MNKKPTEFIPEEYLNKFKHRAADEYTKDRNKEAGNTLCIRCGGTGNEFFSMYRICKDCDGTGVQGMMLKNKREDTCQQQ